VNGIFDDAKLKFNVNVRGTFDDYRRYKESQKMSKKTLQGVVIIVGAIFAGALAMMLIHSAFAMPPAPSTFWHDFTQLAVTATQMSWASYAKFMLFLLAPIIAISWLFHGVQARLLA
jgi:hypothetical protein